MINDIIQYLINGLVQGSVYALIALGYSLVYGVLRMVNFAHGEFYMIGAFISFGLLKFFSVPLFPAVVISAILTGIFSVLLERSVYLPVRNQPKTSSLLAALGASLLLQNVGQALFGAAPRGMPVQIEDNYHFLGDFFVTDMQMIIMGVTSALLLTLWLIVNKTKVGLSLRAVSFNKDVAELMGINSNTMISIAFLLGGGFAAIAGTLIGLYYNSIDPMMGVVPGIKAFTAAVIGGIGYLPGTACGALLIGILENLVVGFIGGSYKDIVTFALLIAILILKPNGLFNKSKAIEKV